MSETQTGQVARRMLKGMAVIIFFGLFAKFGGLLMSIVMAWFFKAGRVVDAYSEVWGYVVFTFFYSTMLKVFVPAFMPLFSELRENEGEESAWRFASTALNLLLGVSLVIVVAGALLAPQIIALLVPGFDAETQGLAAAMLRFMMPGAFVFLFAAGALAVLNSYKIFSFPSSAEATQKLFWVGTLFLLVRVLGMSSESPIIVGFLVGCAMQFVVLFIGMRPRMRLYTPRLPAMSLARVSIEAGIVLVYVVLLGVWIGLVIFVTRALGDTEFASFVRGNQRFIAITGGVTIVSAYALHLWYRARGRLGVMGRFALLAAPLLLGVAFARYRDLTTALFQSYTQTGVFGILEFAKKIGNMPTVLVAYSFSIAMFPFLCDLAARRDTRTFGDLLTRTLQTIALFFVPLSIVMITLGRPMFSLVYNRGEWQAEYLTYGGWALAFYCSALFFYAIENVVMQAFFSIQRMWTPTILGTVFVVVHALFLFVSIRVLGPRYPNAVFVLVAVSFPLTRALKNIVLLAVLRHRVPLLPLRETGVFALKLAAVCVGVGATLVATRGPAQRLARPERFDGRTVMVDSFNAEPRGWFSHTVPDITVAVPKDSPNGRRALIDPYPRLPDAAVLLTRDLTDFRTKDIQGLSVQLSATVTGQPTAQYRLGLVSPSHIWTSQPLTVTAEATTLTVDLPEADREAFAAAPPGTLQIIDANPPEKEVALKIYEVDVVTATGTVTIDNFNPGAPQWDGLGDGAAITWLPNKPAEYALRIENGPHTLRRSLAAYRLADTTQFRFKAMSDAPVALTMRLEYAGESGPTVTKDIAVSETRRSYDIAVSRLGLKPSLPPTAILFEVPADFHGRIWLDNLSFVRPVRSLSFEAAKLAVVLVPCLAGLVVFIVICGVLRVEEALMVYRWLHARGWRARKKSAGGTPSAGSSVDG